MALIGPGGVPPTSRPYIPQMVSGSYTLNPARVRGIFDQRPTKPMPQTSMPGATAGGSQIDRPGGTSGYSPAAPKTPYDQFQSLFQGDIIRNAQLRNLNAQLGGQWTGNVLPQAQQLLIGYGGDASKLDLSRFAPTDLSGTSLGPSFAQALADPLVSGAATGNPYSALAQIQRANQAADASARAQAAGRGTFFSSAPAAAAASDLEQANQ